MINVFLKKSTIDIYYEKNQNFIANRLMFLDFPSTVHTNLCLLSRYKFACRKLSIDCGIQIAKHANFCYFVLKFRGFLYKM